MTWFVLKTLFVILTLILIPGWGIISIANYWRKWNTLQRWFLASAVSIAFGLSFLQHQICFQALGWELTNRRDPFLFHRNHCYQLAKLGNNFPIGDKADNSRNSVINASRDSSLLFNILFLRG